MLTKDTIKNMSDEQIAEIKNDADEIRVVTSMRENYGELPAETLNLIKIVRIGANVDHYLRTRNALTFDYKAKRVICEY